MRRPFEYGTFSETVAAEVLPNGRVAIDGQVVVYPGERVTLEFSPHPDKYGRVVVFSTVEPLPGLGGLLSRAIVRLRRRLRGDIPLEDVPRPPWSGRDPDDWLA